MDKFVIFCNGELMLCRYSMRKTRIQDLDMVVSMLICASKFVFAHPSKLLNLTSYCLSHRFDPPRAHCGRASTILPSGTPIVRPMGHLPISPQDDLRVGSSEGLSTS
jgi:hypothetical protein